MQIKRKTENPELLTDAVKRLKGSGFTIEMDDFGSGYSSLNSLKDIDIDILKLDMKFLSESKNKKKERNNHSVGYQHGVCFGNVRYCGGC